MKAIVFAIVLAAVAVAAQEVGQENLEGSESLYLAAPYGAFGSPYGAIGSPYGAYGSPYGAPYGAYAAPYSPAAAAYPGSSIFPGGYGIYRR